MWVLAPYTLQDRGVGPLVPYTTLLDVGPSTHTLQDKGVGPSTLHPAGQGCGS